MPPLGIVDSLIFDLGMHKGEDTDFYLAKGFNVIAVEANPDLCDEVARRLSFDIESGRLTIVNAAITEKPGPIRFYQNPNTVWGTTSSAWTERNTKLGSPAERVITVDGIAAGELITTYGVPYFMKIDIEGADLLALEALRDTPVRPTLVSIESDKCSWEGVLHEFDLLEQLGYHQFKVVSQAQVSTQVPPKPAQEGRYADWVFEFGSSGLFGEEIPGPWLTREQALHWYELAFMRYRFFGDEGLYGPCSESPEVGDAMRGEFGDESWFDTHARADRLSQNAHSA